MTPAGQNYPIAEHSVLFWAVYLTIAVLTTFALMLLFLWQVHRNSQATRADLTVVEGTTALPTAAEPASRPAISHSAA